MGKDWGGESECLGLNANKQISSYVFRFLFTQCKSSVRDLTGPHVGQIKFHSNTKHMPQRGMVQVTLAVPLTGNKSCMYKIKSKRSVDSHSYT